MNWGEPLALTTLSVLALACGGGVWSSRTRTRKVEAAAKLILACHPDSTSRRERQQHAASSERQFQNTGGKAEQAFSVRFVFGAAASPLSPDVAYRMHREKPPNLQHRLSLFL
jgi:hypothetical protein